MREMDNEKTQPYGTGVPRSKGHYSVEAEQERFSHFIQAENERLNRLIRNLYLYLLQFKHYSERDLYDRICQEVAEYFRAASCELYHVRYEEGEPGKKKSKVISSRLPDGSDSKRCLTKWLELVGAYGPARRALRQHYVRRPSRSLYEVPILESPDPTEITGMTRRGFVNEDPTRYASAYDFRPARKDSRKQETSKNGELRTESTRQTVWYQDGLYNSCRCSLMVSLMRESRKGAEEQGTHYHRKIGLIKVENRTPYDVPGFSDVPSEGVNQNHLFFTEEWKIAALRPYVRDLQESVKKGRSPFFPLHNNIGWQQYFEDHPLGAHYFQQLLQWLRQHYDAPDTTEVVKQLIERYEFLADWLENLVECLIRLESWLQHLRYACCLMCGVGERPTLDKPTPSLFNVYNLRAAYLESEKSLSSASPASDSEKSNYDVVCDALLDCLTGRNRDAKEELRALVDRGDKREVEKCIQRLCQKRVEAMREKLGIIDKQFDIARCLNEEPPAWKFQETLCEVRDDLALICQALEEHKPKEREEEYYELMSEEIEVRRISKVVRIILDGDGQGEKEEDDGVACALLGRDEPHEEPAATGCKAARALAAATMYADSFHQIDEKRLIFIASHIVQVLDNHLLYQSRQRGLELDFDTLNVIGLEHFGLELLDTLYSCSQRIARGLGYLLEQEAYRRGEDDLQLQSKLTLPKEFVKEISGSPRTDFPQKNGGSLLSIEYPSAQRVGALVLEQIAGVFYRLKESLHWLRAEPVRDPEGITTRIAFLPNENLIPNDKEPHAQIVLLESANGNEAGKEKVELLVWLKGEDLQAHDLRALWSAVKVLEEVLKVTEAAAGGDYYAPTTTRRADVTTSIGQTA